MTMQDVKEPAVAAAAKEQQQQEIFVVKSSNSNDSSEGEGPTTTSQSVGSFSPSTPTASPEASFFPAATTASNSNNLIDMSNRKDSSPPESSDEEDYDGGIFMEGDTPSTTTTTTPASAVTTTTTPTTTKMMASLDELPDSFNKSPEPVMHPKLVLAGNDSNLLLAAHPPPAAHIIRNNVEVAEHNYHLLCQIREDSRMTENDGGVDDTTTKATTNILGGDGGGGTLPPQRLSSSSYMLQRFSSYELPLNDETNKSNRSINSNNAATTSATTTKSPLQAAATPAFSALSRAKLASSQQPYFIPFFSCSKLIYWISKQPFVQRYAKDGNDQYVVATWMGFFALLNVTCANYVLSPMRDAVALQVGVANIPKLTLASSILAFFSSVPIGWLFEAPDPSRRKVWKRMGLTRGETQGTSLALFYRFFAISVLSYAVGFTLVDWYSNGGGSQLMGRLLSATNISSSSSPSSTANEETATSSGSIFSDWIQFILNQLGSGMYIAFFLVVHLMKLHSISLVWGVTTEAMEYEDVARKHHQDKASAAASSASSLSSNDDDDDVPTKTRVQAAAPSNHHDIPPPSTKTRLQRLAFVGFGGTLGGLLGSILASSMANVLRLPGLLVLSAFLLEISAELSIELGRIMQKHWEEQQIFRSCQDLTSLVDSSMQRSTSLGSMKRIASGNSLYRVASSNSMTASKSMGNLDGLDKQFQQQQNSQQRPPSPPPPPEDTFTQRLLRGITTILRSRLLMAIFTYNALFASTSVLLSFQRAELVANRNSVAGADHNSKSISNDTAFLANINMASSMAVFAMQASGIGAVLAQTVGSRGSLALMPIIRTAAVLGLAWWHLSSGGQPPNLILFLMLDECTRVVNLAIAKPVRESLWRGLSNEARYEAKPIVDTLANRWGAGSASFCVSVISKLLLWWGMETGELFGLPPVLFLCLIAAAWWAMVSLDLGHIRARIDLELKKRQ